MNTEPEEVIEGDDSHEDSSRIYEVISYGVDYSVDRIVSRLKDESIVIPAFGEQIEGARDTHIEGFQRGFVWDNDKMDRFIESLLMGLPVPGVFLYKSDNGKLIVVDGQQRLNTLRAFCKGKRGRGEQERLYTLSKKITEKFRGKTYEKLEEKDRRNFNDRVIHATVVEQKKPEDDHSSMYAIFERLNTGGVNLKPQEIRVVAYHGELVRVLSELNNYEKWRTIWGHDEIDKHLRDMELIVRFFALFYNCKEYTGSIKGFINDYMQANRELQEQDEKELSQTFKTAIDLLSEAIKGKLFRFTEKSRINGSVMDSVLCGVAKRLKGGKVYNTDAFREAYKNLIENKEYQGASKNRTSNSNNVNKRLQLAREAFSQVE